MKKLQKEDSAYGVLKELLEEITEAHNISIFHTKNAIDDDSKLVSSMLGISHALGIQSKLLESLINLLEIDEENENRPRIGF